MNTDVNFILMDAARLGWLIETARELNHQFVSLYRGRPEADIENFGPFLFDYPGNDAFAAWVRDNVWGQDAAIFIRTGASMEECLLHFQTQIVTKDGKGREQYFRFYDPRVVRSFLPGLDKNRIAALFGPVEAIIAESAEPGRFIEFKQQQGTLQQQEIGAEKMGGYVNKPVFL